MNRCAFSRRFLSPRAARHLPRPTSQSIDSASKSAWRSTQRWLYRHIKTLIVLGKLVFEVRVPAHRGSR